ncbi:hypothetical protein ARMGADRAFT_818708 [Armillaria gallica]|uniref:Uncharacterized protein n=1 Tax=Armillaria gallica TaxID=47427 RepID=A0A2H3CHS1_ARMGA|nr:hypothetical protein ARMGADRAFT_818708 [Armillaria gallica]
MHILARAPANTKFKNGEAADELESDLTGSGELLSTLSHLFDLILSVQKKPPTVIAQPLSHDRLHIQRAPEYFFRVPRRAPSAPTSGQTLSLVYRFFLGYALRKNLIYSALGLFLTMGPVYICQTP